MQAIADQLSTQPNSFVGLGIPDKKLVGPLPANELAARNLNQIQTQLNLWLRGPNSNIGLGGPAFSKLDSIASDGSGKNVTSKSNFWDSIFNITPGRSQAILLDSEELIKNESSFKIILKTIYKYRHQIISMSILSGLIFICFKNRRKAKQFLKKIFKIFQRIHNFSNRKIFRNPINRSLWIIYRYINYPVIN